MEDVRWLKCVCFRGFRFEKNDISDIRRDRLHLKKGGISIKAT